MRRFTLVAIAGVLLAGHALAEPLNYNVVNLEASASKDVNNDLATASLFVELTDTDPSRLAEKVNQTLNAALKVVKQTSSVQAAGTGYATYPVYNNKTNKQEAWRGRGELRLTSRDFPTLSRLLGQLQQPLASGLPLQLAGIRYGVSDDARKQAEDTLIQQSMQAFRQRADLVRQGFAGASWRMVNVNVNTSDTGPQPMMMSKVMSMRAPAADAAPAPLEAGDSKLSVTVSGSIQIQ